MSDYIYLSLKGDNHWIMTEMNLYQKKSQKEGIIKHVDPKYEENL